jgi:hypothetical protein
MNNLTKRHLVTLIIDTNDTESSEHDLMRNFKIHNEFQINDTHAKIVVCGVKIKGD